ncbi:MAG: hypothetical protein FJ253_06400 [Phycisphaerae bacterium]|nr:hypothetical protein [Phycisphaerae bacterium]
MNTPKNLTLNRGLNRTAMMLAIGGALAGASLASAGIDREILGVAITPSSPGELSFYDISLKLTVATTPSSAPTNASMLVALQRNGSTVPGGLATINVQLDGGSGFCGAGGCGPSCGGGYINGVFNTMLCLKDPPDCAGGCDCECRFPSITWEFPNQEFEPGDEIVVILIPAPGSAPEPTGDTNHKWTTIFDGIPHFWQRRVQSVEVVAASSGRPGLVDLVVSGDAIWHGIKKPSDLGFDVHCVDPTGNSIASGFVLGGVSPNGDGLACGGIGCGGLCGFWNGNQVDCFAFPNVNFLPCVCGGGWIIQFLDLDPNDLDGTKIVLKPAPGSLPELPGFPSDPTPVCPDTDLTGDCFVDGDDLGTLLGQWGPCAGCSADFNNDGVVDGDDLGQLLGDWS